MAISRERNEKPIAPDKFFISSRPYKSFAFETLNSPPIFPVRAGISSTTRIKCFLYNVIRARGEDRRHSHRQVSSPCYATRSQVQRTTHTCSLVQPSSSALILAFALRTLTSNKHIPFISTPAQAFISGVGVPPNQTTKPTILRNCGFFLFQKYSKISKKVALKYPNGYCGAYIGCVIMYT